MTGTQLGHIASAKFGRGGYGDAQIGLSLTFRGDGWGASWFRGGWFEPPGPDAAWTVEEQREAFAGAVVVLRDALRAARRSDVSRLVGTPVEVVFGDGVLVDWRVLTEVIL